ncbi:MAG: hypothetical protein ABSA45_11660, partial [Verrucomicrobiota bacterium]
AIPNSDNGGNGSGGSDSSGNPGSGQAQSVQTPVNAPEGVYITMYKSHQDYDFTPCWFQGDYMALPHQYDWLDWYDGRGGCEDKFHVDFYPDYGGVYVPALINITWPATSWPQDLPAGAETTTSWWYGNDSSSGPGETSTGATFPPPLAMESCHIAVSREAGNGCTETYQRDADVQIKLATGGSAGSTRMNLWVISANARDHLPPWLPPFGGDITTFFTPWDGVYGASIDPSRIAILDQKLGSDGKLYVMLPDNTDPDITPAIAGAPDYYTLEITAQKYTLTILAGSSTTNADLSVAAPEFCVGQLVSFVPGWSPSAPPYVAASSFFHWHLPDKFVNESYHPYPSSTCTSYRRNDDLLTARTTFCWFVNGNGGACSVGMSLQFDNGQVVSPTAMGNFTVYRPQMTHFAPDPVYMPFTPMLNNGWLELGNDLRQPDGQMKFDATVETKVNFPGTVNWTQLINRSTTYATSTSGYWLDNGQIFNGAGNVNPITSPPFWLVDNPGVAGVWAYVSVTDAYKTYLVFTPNGDAIGVTLGVVTWGWSGTETFGALSSSSVTSPSYSDSDEFPEWPNVLHSAGE